MNAIEKMDSLYFRWCPVVVMSAFFAVVLNKLAMMQLEGLLGFGGAFVTSLFAITSLMYARARAVTDQIEKAKRAKVADESLKASFIAVMGLAITAYAFLSLADDYPRRPGHMLEAKAATAHDIVPALVAFVCIAVFAIPTIVKILHVVEMTVEDMGLVLKGSKTVKSPSTDN